MCHTPPLFRFLNILLLFFLFAAAGCSRELASSGTISPVPSSSTQERRNKSFTGQIKPRVIVSRYRDHPIDQSRLPGPELFQFVFFPLSECLLFKIKIQIFINASHPPLWRFIKIKMKFSLIQILNEIILFTIQRNVCNNNITIIF